MSSRLAAEAHGVLLDAIYAAATDVSRWPEFIDRVSDCFGGPSTLFLRPGDDPSGTRILAGNLDPERINSHNAYYAKLIPWRPHVGRSHPVLDLGEDRVAMEEFLRTEYYNDWMRPQDLLYWVGVRPDFGDDGCLGLGVSRSGRHEAFSECELNLLMSISGHLQRAGEIARRLTLFDAQAQATSALLDDLNAGVLLVDADLRVRFVNAVAEELLAAGDGLCVRSGRLRTATPRLQATLSEAVRRATRLSRDGAAFGSTLTLKRSGGAAPLALNIGPLDERSRAPFAMGPLAIIVIGAPERDTAVDPERLRAAYDLTPAEARLAVALCAGRSLAEHAVDAGVSLNTVKYHLKAVFEKTGESRQPDLVRRLIGNPALRRSR